MRLNGWHLRSHPTSDYKLSWLFLKFQQFLCITCSTIESGGSSAFGNELPKKGGAWLSGIAAKVNTTGTPPGGPKSRKLHLGESVGRSHVSPPKPPYKSKIPKGGFGTGPPPKPNEVGSVGRGGAAERLSFCPERQNEGCGACDDEARLSPLSFVVQRKMGPSETVGCRTRQVKTNKTQKQVKQNLPFGRLCRYFVRVSLGVHRSLPLYAEAVGVWEI